MSLNVHYSVLQKKKKKRILYKITNYFPSEEQRLENEPLVFVYATFVIRKPTKP